MLFQTPALSDRDKAVLQELGNYRRSLRSALRQPRRWTGNLRRNLQARAIRGSNTIEGYEVSLDNALAAVDEEEPLDVDRSTWAEIVGYRNAMSYVQQLSSAPHFEYNATLLSSLHYMMLSHDLTTLPGHFRPGPIYAHDDDTGEMSTRARTRSSCPVWSANSSTGSRLITMSRCLYAPRWLT